MMDRQAYEQHIRDTCNAAGVEDIADRLIAANVSGTTLHTAIRDAKVSNQSDRQTAILNHPSIAAQLGRGGSNTASTSSSAPAAPTSTDPGVAAIDALVAEKQAAHTEAEPADAPASYDDAGARAVDQVLAERSAT